MSAARAQPKAAPHAGGLSALFREHHAFVWRSARRLGAPPHLVDDVVQDVFLAVHQQLDRFEARSSIKTWLFAITANTVRAWFRRERRHQRRVGALARVRQIDQARDPSERHAAVDLLDRMLRKLEPDQRNAFILIELEDVAPREVANACGVSVNTIHSRLRLARKRLDREVQRIRARDRRTA